LKAGKVCIYVDHKPLKESILWVTHPLPHVDEIIAWATILDANSSFGKFHSQNTQSFYKIYNGIWFQQTPIWDYHAKLSKNK